MIECRAPEVELRRRLRHRAGGISDAREQLLDTFMQRFEPMEEFTGDEFLVLDTTQTAAACIDRVLESFPTLVSSVPGHGIGR